MTPRCSLTAAALLTFLASCGGSSPAQDAGTGTDAGQQQGDGGSAPGVDAGSQTDTSALYCSHSASVPVPGHAGLTSTVSYTCSADTRTMASNGLPDHATGTFPNPNCPNTISAQSVTQVTPLRAVVDVTTDIKEPGHLLNGVKLDPATAESYQNAGTWRIEAIQQYRDLGLDQSHAHVQPSGAYHYHGMPQAFLDALGKGEAMTFVGFAADGFPLYARYGHADAMDATSALVAMTPSWRLKATADSGRPSSTEVPMGTFTQDWEYVPGLGQLDECNGRYGVTPEFPGGTYHYFITDAYPFIQRCVKGKVAAGSGGGGGGGNPKSCTAPADCTGACPQGSAGCTCGSSPQGNICVPTCASTSDCPKTQAGQQMTCVQGLCRPPL